MPTTNTPQPQFHEGRNLKRLREILGIKQDALAAELGDDWNQQKISLLEQKEVLDPQVLEQVAKALKVPVEAIKNFSEEAAIFNIQNNYEKAYEGATNFHASAGNYQCTFNPIDKVVELYERLLKEKDDLIAKLAGEKKK